MVMFVVRSLYGIKTASKLFRTFVEVNLHEMGFEYYMDDQDVWILPGAKSDE